MAAPNSGIFVGDPVLSKKPPQKRPDNGRSAAFFMATYGGNPISIINEGSSNMAGRSHLEITLPWQISTPGARIRSTAQIWGLSPRGEGDGPLGYSAQVRRPTWWWT